MGAGTPGNDSRWDAISTVVIIAIIVGGVSLWLAGMPT